MAKPKLPTFVLQFDIKANIMTEIKAESFEAALEEAKTYKTSDLVDYGSHDVNWDEIEVMGVYK